MPPAIVISLVVFLLVLAALCGVLAIWTIVNDLKAADGSPQTWRPAAGRWVIEVPPATPVRATVPRDLLVRRRPPPSSLARDDDDDDEYTEVDDGVTTIRDPRFAVRR